MFAARTRSPERPEHAERQSLDPLGAPTKLVLLVQSRTHPSVTKHLVLDCFAVSCVHFRISPTLESRGACFLAPRQKAKPTDDQCKCVRSVPLLPCTF